MARVVTTISSNRPRSKHRRQRKDENNGNAQSQRGDCWPWVHRGDVQCGVDRASLKLRKTADGCECSTEENLLLSTGETV